MIVPNISQLIDGQGGDRCGEACLAACLQALGKAVSMLDVVHILNKPINQATSTIGDLLHATALYGMHGKQLNTQADTFIALSSKRAVIVLLYNAFLTPSPYPAAPSWYGNHFVVLEEQHGDLLEIMDPLAFPGSQHVSVTAQSFFQSVHAVPINPWGLCVYTDLPSKTSTPQGPKVCH